MANYLLTPEMIIRELQRLAFHFSIRSDYNLHAYCSNEYTIIVEHKNQKRELLLETRQLVLSLDDFVEIVLKPFIYQFMSEDQKFIHFDYT